MNHGLTHVFWADTETGENIDWDFFNREFIGSKHLLRELFPTQKVKTFVIPGYAWLVDLFGEQIYDEVPASAEQGVRNPDLDYITPNEN